MNNFSRGFTLVEMIVIVSIISILTAVISLNFNDIRAGVRDDTRKTELGQLQVAIELYKAQYGYYPAEGCAGVDSADTPETATWDGNDTWTGPGPQTTSVDTESCGDYIVGLVPDFIAKLPTDPRDEGEDSKGYAYRTDADGTAYKVIISETVEVDFIGSYSNPLSRCPFDSGDSKCDLTTQRSTYGIYSLGAEVW